MVARRIEEVETLADLADVAPPSDPPSEAELRQLRADIAADLIEITAGWNDRPDSPLRITKARLQLTGICHAQVLAEAEPFTLDSDVARGTICDMAAGFVVVYPTFQPVDGWFEALRWALSQERPDVIEFVDGLHGDAKQIFLATVDERCDALPALIGDIRDTEPTVRERARLHVTEANALLNTETDLVLRRPHALIEVKSGRLGPWVIDELRFYALVRSLRDLRTPDFLCSMSLADQQLTALPLRRDDLFATARRVVDAAEALVAIDQAVVSGEQVPTSPGGHCRWCRMVRTCPAPSEAILSELPPPSDTHAIEVPDDD